MGFNPSLLKKRMTDPVLLWCILQAGLPSLHYYCAVVLHSCIVLPSVGHSSNHEYHFCQLTRQSSRVSNFYRTLKFSFDSPLYVTKLLIPLSLRSTVSNIPTHACISQVVSALQTHRLNFCTQLSLLPCVSLALPVISFILSL